MRFEPDALYYGDCLDVMRAWPAGCVDLCYLDPPFNSKTNYNILFGRERGRADTGGNLAQFVAFEDTWTWDDAAQERVVGIERAIGHPAHDAIRGLRIMLGDCGMLAYLSYMAERLVEIRRVLKPEGSIYLHCDPTASHYLKTVMDAVFGTPSFRNEIIWSYRRWPSKSRKFQTMHDVILFYAGERGATFNISYELPSASYVKRFKGKTQVLDPETKSRKLVVDEPTKGLPERDVWEMSILAGSSKERLGYPTQKPLALLERIMRASSNPGDIVLDPFCGCGTTVAAARKLNRRFVGIDISHFAIDLVRDRRLMDKRIPVNGVPVDMDTAARLAKDDPFEFEKWAVTRVPGMVPNTRQVGDAGIDGRGKLLDGGLVLAQVKGGRSVPLGQVRDFRHVLAREKAACGIFATLRPLASGKAKAEASAAGTFRLGASRYPRAQFWTIEDYFQGRFPVLPPLADPYTGKPMQLDILAS